MFKPSRYIRICSLMITLATLAGCADEGLLLGPDASSSLALGLGNGGNGGGGNGGRGNVGGGDGGSNAPLVEDFDFWDPSAWVPGDHKLGRGFFKPENVSHRGSKLFLTLPAGGYDGAEIKSASRVKFRDVEVRLRTPRAPGSFSAFFLYEFVQTDDNDEIDMEIFNDGSRQIWFTTWVDGIETNHVELILPFDPAVRYHNYRIEWSRRRVRFLVDGVLMQEWKKGVPGDAMYVMSNAWWPTWMTGPTLGGYGLLYEVSKSTKKTAPDDAFFLESIEHIRKTFDGEGRSVRASMGGALIGIGKRNATLNAAALELARAIGPIRFGTEFEPLDVVKHLTSDRLREKLGWTHCQPSNVLCSLPQQGVSA